MKKNIFIMTLILKCHLVFAQDQIDMAGNFSVGFEKKISQSFALTNLNSIRINEDFHELSFFFTDFGLKYKLNAHIGFNIDYRYAQRRNLQNAYDTRHFIYADMDLNKWIRRFNIYSTHRFQNMSYGKLIEGYKPSVYYLRNQFGIKFKVNYYLQPFTEIEFFTPLLHSQQSVINQYRIAGGFGYTFNQKIKLTMFEQVQQLVNRTHNNTNILTSFILSFRW